MFGFDPLSSNERAEADALHDYLDDLNAGVLAPQGEIDPNLAATVSQVQRSGRQPVAPYGLKSQIWEDLMSNTPSATVAPGSIAAPATQRSGRSGAFARATQPLGRVSRALPSLNYYAAAVILVVMIMAGGIGAYSLRPESTNPSTGGNSMPAAIAQTSPAAEAPKDLLQVCYDQPALELKDVFRIVNSAVFQTPYITDSDPNATEPVRQPTIVDLPVDTPIGANADQETRQAVMQAYLAFRLCSAQGFDLQSLALFTPAGVARLLVPSGSNIDFGTIVSLLDDRDAVQQEGISYPSIDDLTNEVESIQVLEDGRVVLALRSADAYAAYANYQYLIFANDGNHWLIDDLAWATIG